jgi:hypothetical protein
VQALAVLIRESNEADRIDLERQKLVNTTTAFEHWGAPTIDGVLVSELRKQVNSPQGTAVAGPPAEMAAGPGAKPASTEKGKTDADLPGPKAVPAEIVEAIREIDKMTPAERMLAKSIFFGVQNLACLELKAVAEDEAMQAETEPKPPKGEHS